VDHSQTHLIHTRLVALVKRVDKADKGVSFSPHLSNTRTFEFMVRQTQKVLLFTQRVLLFTQRVLLFT